MSTAKVAVITGGASGIGLAVAKSLSADGWQVHVLYRSPAPAIQAAQALPLAHFTQADVTSWVSLSSAFEKVFSETGQIDFVFANAGIIQPDVFFSNDHSKDIRDSLNMSMIHVNLQGVIYTSCLARDYFRRSPHKGQGAVLLMNSSSAGLHPTGHFPTYSASKAGVLGFMRAIAKPMFESDGIRVHALCPGLVRTSILEDGSWAHFPEEQFISMEFLVDVVISLMNDTPWKDSTGRWIKTESKFGLAVEVTPRGFYVKGEEGIDDQSIQSTLQAIPTGLSDAMKAQV